MSDLISALSLEGSDGVQVPLMSPGYRLVQHTEGFTGVRVRGSVRPAVGRDGSIVNTRYRDDRVMTITGIVLDGTAGAADRAWDEWDGVEAAFASAVDTDRLLMWQSGTQLLQATVRCEELTNPVETGPAILRYQATLRNPGGVAYSQTEQIASTVPLAASGGGGWVMPEPFPITFAASAGGFVIVTNDGGVNSLPLLILKGGMSSPIIQCGDQRIVIDGDIASGDELWLNAADRSVLLNGDPLSSRRSMLRSSVSRWFAIPPQGPTTISLFTSTFDGTAGLEVHFRNAT